jgi:O-succinylbenzoate synthase
VQIDGLELVHVALPLKTPFTTSFGSVHTREVLLVRAQTSLGEGWGECVADARPLYCSEYADGAAHVIEHHLAPMLFAAPDVTAETAADLMAPVSGHRMAKAAVEMAVLDAQLRSRGLSFAGYLGVTRDTVPAGVSIGIQDGLPELLEVVARFLGEGYPRIKLKIKPGWDLRVVEAVRREFGGELLLQVDANAAYRLADARTLRALDEFDLLLIEQPLANEDLRQHAELARLLRTPICLDESIVSAAAAADAIALRAAQIINIKPGRVGGYLEARRIHDLCQANGIAVWCGGMLETGIGRSANAALAGLPGFTLPGDLSASDRFYEADLTPPIRLVDGQIQVPANPGIAGTPDPAAISAFARSRTWIANPAPHRRQPRPAAQ